MHPRRWLPVAALTLAMLAAPFLAATAVAAQADGGRPATPARPATMTWLSTTKASIQRVVDAVEALDLAAVETIAPPVAQAPAPAVRASAPPPAPPVSDPASWIWPANGPVTSPFGRRWGRMHEGVDIDAAYGSAVVAAQRGTVTAAGWGMSGYGRVVQIDHGNGITTFHAHLSSVTVTVGQVVAQGQQVGAVGASGSVTAAHLHYEVRVGGAPKNPMPWLTGAHSSAGNPG